MIDIIIPTKGNLNYLFKCLTSIKDNTTVDYHIHIADTGSTEDELNKTAEFLKQNFRKTKNASMYLYDYYNFAKINNDMVSNTNAEWLLFCNNDVFLKSPCIDKMLQAAEKHKDKVGTMGCRLVYPNGKVQHAGQIALLYASGELAVTHRGIGTENKYKNGNVMGNTGALMLTSRERFDEISGFNEEYLECFEDVEYNMECIRCGYKNGYIDDVEAVHAESVSRGKSWEALRRVTSDYDCVLRPYWNKLDLDLRRHILKISGHI